MTIAVDVDETVAALMPEWIARYNENHRDTLDHKNVSHWDVDKFVKPEVGKAVYSILNDADLYECVCPINGALAGVRKLHEMGHRVIFVTSCVGPQMHPKKQWLHRHGFMDAAGHDTEYIVCHDKSLIRADIIIDDGPHNLEGFVGGKILFDAPHNQSEERFCRAKNWEVVVDAIELTVALRKVKL